MHDTSESLLRSIPIFRNLESSHLQTISAALELRDYQPGDDIVAQGRPADGLVIVLSGAALLFRNNDDGSQEPLATLKTNQFVNQDALFADVIQSASLRASQPVTVAKLTRDRFERLLRQDEGLRSAFGLVAQTEARQISPQFAEQREDEEVLIFTHRHWWSFLRSAWLPLLAMPLIWIAALIIQAHAITLLLFALSFLLPGLMIIYFIAEWRNDALIVTDQRIIRIERTILAMHKQITQVGLESVHEINFEYPSYDPFARIFRYGSLIIKTAGAQGNLKLDLIPNPEQFQKLIIEDRQYFEQRQAQRHHDQVRAEMQKWLTGDNTDEDDLTRASTDDGPPKPLVGTNGYLSTRIVMSNGDIVYRKHISVWAQHTFLPLLVILAAATGLLLTFTLVGPDLRIVTFTVSMVALLLGCVVYYWLDWDWRNDIYVISDDTITLVHKRPFFLQNLRDQILMERIDNVESVTTGFFAALLKYGDVRMSLIGADEHKLFHKVTNPQAIQQEISRRQHNKAQRKARYDAAQQRQILGEYLGAANLATLQQAAAATAPASPPSAQHHASPDSLPYDGDAPVGSARAAHNHDRNRPPRLPRKLISQGTAPQDQSMRFGGERQRSRPRRFRTNTD